MNNQISPRNNNVRCFSFQASVEITIAVLDAMIARYANIRFWATPNGSSNNFDLNFVIHSDNSKVTKAVANKIENDFLIALHAVKNFRKSTSGEVNFS